MQRSLRVDREVLTEWLRDDRAFDVAWSSATRIDCACALRRQIQERLAVFPLDGQQPLALILREQLLASRGRFGDRGIDALSFACRALISDRKQ
ncbi:hypothetical protein [Burkholderia cenocepacia]|uniref:hypothetical protein n=1 Tax=Burkholderia cenocepacia TaxID=95486 RepID=UPI0009878662|nr:hypothetical protein [Burkholderia cenocepacia]MBR8075988.1 hypothetical protein [Burkholderia cenocepacia]ONW33941.1 hypothetical protein A8E95_12110 [Burkholderia cenocepacia]